MDRSKITVPMFTVLLPAKSRPLLVRDALSSVLGQDYHDFEVIVSNNGADAQVKAAIADLLADSRVRYVEQPAVLSMPDHWERLSLMARGRYLIVVTDRSVLRKDALSTVARIHDSRAEGADIVTWSWDLYYDKLRVLLPFSSHQSTPVVLDAEKVALDSLGINGGYPAALPRGLNSSVSMDVVSGLRSKAGRAFWTISPDFSFAYSCLLNASKITHIDDALMLSQGLDVSNGGNAFLTDASRYVETLGLARPIVHSPIDALFVENIIAEDFFAACDRFGRDDLVRRVDRSNLYIKCFLELAEKRHARVLSSNDMKVLANSIHAALEKEDDSTKCKVADFLSETEGFTRLVRRYLKRVLVRRGPWVQRKILLLRGGEMASSALCAAGHTQRLSDRSGMRRFQS